MGIFQIINLAGEALKYWQDELEEALSSDRDKNAIVYRQRCQAKIEALEHVINEFSEA